MIPNPNPAPIPLDQHICKPHKFHPHEVAMRHKVGLHNSW